MCVFLFAVNQDFFRAAAMRNAVVNIAGKNDSCSFLLQLLLLLLLLLLLFGYREVFGIRRKIARDNPES